MLTFTTSYIYTRLASTNFHYVAPCGMNGSCVTPPSLYNFGKVPHYPRRSQKYSIRNKMRQPCLSRNEYGHGQDPS